MDVYSVICYVNYNMKANKLNYNFTESHNLSVLIIFKSGVIITPE